MEFCIKAWSAWAPTSEQEATLPVLSQVPPMTRRRLSRLTRMSFDTVLQCTEPAEQLSTVFASRHGDLHKTLQLLQQLAVEDDLSPAQFALSVHNAISGQLSIYQGNQADSTAIAAGPDSLHYAVLDAALRLNTDPSVHEIMVIYADEPVPSVYQPFCQDPVNPIALALRLSRQEGIPVRFDTHYDSAAEASLNQAHQLLCFLDGRSSTAHIHGKNRQWSWQRR